MLHFLFLTSLCVFLNTLFGFNFSLCVCLPVCLLAYLCKLFSRCFMASLSLLLFNSCFGTKVVRSSGKEGLKRIFDESLQSFLKQIK